jgi:ferritin-like metal-binding protein YciE
LDSKKTYEDKDGNDVILLGSVSQEEIKMRMKQRREEFKKTVEKLKEVFDESKNRVKGEDYNE